jgi:tight adherence protein C
MDDHTANDAQRDQRLMPRSGEMTTMFQLLASPSLPILAVAVALLVGGVALIGASFSERNRLIARRVAMVGPVAAPAESRPAPAAPPEHLIRMRARGVTVADQRRIIHFFARFGVPANQAITYFVACRFGVAALCALPTLIWAERVHALQAHALLPFLIAAMAGIAGWLLPTMLLSIGGKHLLTEVKMGLPDALELLVICVEAGLSLEDGLDRVVIELRQSQPALAEELGLTLADLKILPSREQALTNLAERVDIPSVRSVVTTLTQTLRYGTPLAQSLRIVAAEMRNDSLIELEERANRLPVYLTLPVIVFMLPTIFLIVGGPAALRLIDAFVNVNLPWR